MFTHWKEVPFWLCRMREVLIVMCMVCTWMLMICQMYEQMLKYKWLGYESTAESSSFVHVFTDTESQDKPW